MHDNTIKKQSLILIRIAGFLLAELLVKSSFIQSKNFTAIFFLLTHLLWFAGFIKLQQQNSTVDIVRCSIENTITRHQHASIS